MLKLHHYGIRGNTYKWIFDFLLNRTQQVAVRGTLSDIVSVLSGVPQGTALGPLLFLIFINDMPSLVKSTIALFADDAYLLKSISSQHDVDILQGDLNILQTWEGKWSMEFHPEKCQLLRLTNK